MTRKEQPMYDDTNDTNAEVAEDVEAEPTASTEGELPDVADEAAVEAWQTARDTAEAIVNDELAESASDDGDEG